jgi:YVTN family beta-propeller protein
MAPVLFYESIFRSKGDQHMQTRENARIRTAAWRLYALRGMLTSLCALAAWSPLGQAAAATPAAKAYVSNFKDNTVSVIDTATGTVVAIVPVAAGPHGMAVTQDGRTVYVSGDGSSVVDVIDTATDTVVKTITVGKAPNGVALTPDSRWLLATVYDDNRLAFIDTATSTVVATVEVPKPHTVAISPDGQQAIVTVQEPSHFGLAFVDLATRRVVHTLSLEKTPRDGEFGADGKAFYFTQAGVNAVQVLDPAADKIIAQMPTGVSPHFVGYPRGAAVGLVVVQGPGELLVFDPATHQPERSVTVGKQPHWATVSGDGTTAYVTNEGSNDVTVVELATGRTATIAVGTAPRKVVVQPAVAAAGR